jgi:hypothetical protein
MFASDISDSFKWQSKMLGISKDLFIGQWEYRSFPTINLNNFDTTRVVSLARETLPEI